MKIGMHLPVDAAARMRDLGADELLLTPTTLDADAVDRVADLLGDG